MLSLTNTATARFRKGGEKKREAKTKGNTNRQIWRKRCVEVCLDMISSPLLLAQQVGVCMHVLLKVCFPGYSRESVCVCVNLTGNRLLHSMTVHRQDFCNDQQLERGCRKVDE